jgi:hypothetical protein
MPYYKIMRAGVEVGNGYADADNFNAGFPEGFEWADPPPAPPPPKIHTHRSFLKRFTGAEFKAIRNAAKTDGDVDMFMYLFERAQDVNLDDPDTIAGVQMLVAKGILTAPRAAVILA